MKHESTPFVRFFLLASVVFCGVFAKAGNPIPDNPNENDDPYSAPTVCGNPPGPESPPKEVAGNPGAPGCTTCSDDATHTAVGSISFWQRFGRTPLVAEAPIGRMEIYEIGASRLPSGSGILRFNHPLMRRIVDRDVEKNVVTIEEGNGWLITYRDGRPVGRSTAVLDDLRFEPDGTPVERLADRTLVYYNADNTVDHIVTPAGVRIDWGNSGLDVVWDGNAIGQVWSKADGLMDVTKLSPSSFRLSWYPPAAVGEKEDGRYATTGNPGKTFTFSYSSVAGEHRLSLIEWRNETFNFNYLWKSADGLDWTLIRDPDGLALTESVQSERFTGSRRAVRTFSDANGVLRRKTEYYKTGLVGTTLVGTGVIGDDGIENRVWSAVRIEDGVAAAHLASTTNEYGGGTTYTYDEHRRLTSASRLVNGNLSEVTTYQYPTIFVDCFADLRPARRVVTRDSVVVSDVAYSYGFAPDGGRLDTVTRTDPASGVSLVSSRLYYPASSTNAAEAGRLRLAVSEDRTATLYVYAPTTNGGYVRTSTHGYIAEPDASAPGADASRFAISDSQSTRTVDTVSFRGDVVRVDEFVHTGEQWSPAGWTTYTYNLAHRRTGFADHKGDWEASDWICTGPVWQNLADGTAVTNTYDKAKRLATSTHYTPFGAVETSYRYNAVGQIVGTTIATNGIAVRDTFADYDARGRRILSVDEQGRTNTVDYSSDNRTVTITTQSGAITTTTYNTDGSVSTIAGNVRPYELRSYGVDSATGLSWTEVRTAKNETTPSVLASRTYRNALGQTVRVETPAPNNLLRAFLSSYDTLGRLVSEQTEYRTQETPLASYLSPLTTSYEYDALGSIAQTIQTSTSGVWRAQSSSSIFTLDPDGSVWSRDFSVASCSDPSIAALTNRTDRKFAPLSQSERSHIVSYDLRGNATHETETFDRVAARSESRTIVPWAAEPSRSVALAGRTVEVVDFASVTNRFDYDALGQRVTATDGRGNATAFTYDSFGRLASRTDAATNTTTFVYDAAGRTISVIDALGNATHAAYDAADRKIAEWGATYPAVYAYDSYGRTIALATTRDESAGLSWNAVPDLSDPPEEWDVTRWLYDEATGLMTNKVYADGKGPSYAYSPEGLLARRIRARGVTTDYAYDEFDELLAKTYSDETPAVALSYDGIGRLLSAVCEGVSTNLYSYGPFGDLTNEVQNGTILARSFDAFGRPTGYRIGDGLAEGSAVSYAYDTSGRFSSVSSGTNTFEYSYLPGSSLVSGMTASTGHSWERIYEPNRDLIAAVHNRYGDRTISLFNYTNDEIGRRVARVDSGEAFSEAAFERYSYNGRSELIGARRFFGTDLADESHSVPDSSFEYAYDPIGNRISSTEEKNGSPVVTIYESNEINQYTRTVSQGETIPFEYDEDGNVTFDGRFRYSWNGENRMVRAEEVITSTNCTQTDISYIYDEQGRMIAKNLDGTNNVARTNLWDGYNLVRETINGPATYNVWGLDLDGTFQGCGGVGGLLNIAKSNILYGAFYDANGNVSEYVSSDGFISTHYEYSGFGEPMVSNGEQFTHQFCTKPYCEMTRLSEYQYRIFPAYLGRWVNYDPLQDSGGINLYQYAKNDPCAFFDYLGLIYYDFSKRKCKLQVTLTWSLRFINLPGLPEWTRHQRNKWKQAAESVIENYFSNLTLKCFSDSSSCCICHSGVSIDFNLRYRGFFTFWRRVDYVVTVNTNPDHRSYTGIGTASYDIADVLPQNKGYSQPQIPIVHETGHQLGLDHPGGRSNRPFAYQADPASLMGLGMQMRPADFSAAFCDHIKTNDPDCQSWSGR